jgi:hypothetical protein
MNANTKLSPTHVPPEELTILIQELQVAKSELTSGNTSGEIYIQTSKGSAFLMTERAKAIQEVDKMISTKRSSLKSP